MAAQRLKAEISRLEEETGSEKPPEILLLLDASCFVNHLQEIKQLLMAKKCCFLVCQQVMQELDQLKKGTFAINREAREANRYLEQRFKYPSVYLKGQLPHEQSDPHESNVFIPTIHRSILMCASYFMTLDQEFCLVTENAELKSLAQSLSIPVQEFQYWKSRL
ncbi:hypothetical protein EDD86DRAFT_219709 [Gorgonomyces haynaldii]|nr:hypothetical protein EDD86DRAFT_219709 [Gorgonomyces haynaldii]